MILLSVLHSVNDLMNSEKRLTVVVVVVAETFSKLSLN